LLREGCHLRKPAIPRFNKARISNKARKAGAMKASPSSFSAGISSLEAKRSSFPPGFSLFGRNCPLILPGFSSDAEAAARISRILARFGQIAASIEP
jgi:hypothetical protein